CSRAEIGYPAARSSDVHRELPPQTPDTPQSVHSTPATPRPRTSRPVLAQHPTDQLAGRFLDLHQVIGAVEGLRVDLVLVLRARRPRGEPGVLRTHLQTPQCGTVTPC